MSILGDRLRELREEKQLMSKDFAKLMNVEPSTVTNWEKGNRFPKEDVLVSLADYFDVSLDYLLGRTDNRTNNIYNTLINNNSYTLEFDKNLKKNLTKEELDNFIKYLISIDFNVEKALEKANKNK